MRVFRLFELVTKPWFGTKSALRTIEVRKKPNDLGRFEKKETLEPFSITY